MTDNSSGFHILEIHMPSLGTDMGLLLLVGAAVLTMRWWVQLQVGFPGPGQAFEMGCRCPRRPYLPHAGLLWMPGGGDTRGRFEELPSVAAGPPFSRPTCNLGRGLAPPSSPGDEDDVEGGPALGRR